MDFLSIVMVGGATLACARVKNRPLSPSKDFSQVIAAVAAVTWTDLKRLRDLDIIRIIF